MARRINLEAVITARDEASRTFDNFQKKLGNFGRTFDKAVVGGLAAGGIAAVAYAKRAVDAHMEHEAVVARLERGLQNVGEASDEASRKLQDQASALQKVTRFGDEQIISAQGIMTTFDLNADQIGMLTPRILDMAEGLRRSGGKTRDLESLAEGLGKALTQGTGALTRFNVTLTDQQKEAFDAATEMERVEILTEILDDNYEGLAETAGTTLAGQLDILRNSFADINKAVGDTLGEAIEPFIEKITEWAQDEDTIEMAKRTAEAFVEWVETAVHWVRDKLIPELEEFYNFFQTTFGGIILVTIGILILVVLAAAKSIIAALILIPGTIWLVVEAFKRLYHLARAYMSLVYHNVRREVLAIRNWFRNLRRSAIEIWEGLVDRVRGVWSDILSTIRFYVNEIKRLAGGMWSSIREGLPGPVRAALGMFGFESGGIVQQDGLAMVHQGEKVLPRGAHTGGGDGVTINVYGNVNAGSQEEIEDFGEQVARQFKLSQMGAK